MQTELPQAPPAPKKNHKLWLIVGAALIVGAVASSMSSEASPASANTVAVPATSCVDLDAGYAKTNDMLDDLNAVTRSANNGDLVGITSGLENAQFDATEMAAIVSGDPVLYGLFTDLAVVYGNSADSIRAGDLNAAVTGIEQGTAIIDRASSRLETGEVNAC